MSLPYPSLLPASTLAGSSSINLRYSSSALASSTASTCSFSFPSKPKLYMLIYHYSKYKTP